MARAAVRTRRAARPPARHSWDLQALLGSGKVTLDQVLQAFQYDYAPVLRDGRRAPPAQAPVMSYCKGR